MSRTIVSGLRTGPLIFWLGLAVAIGGYVLHEDIVGSGLTETQAYRVLGIFTYPVFYGALVIALVQFVSMFLGRKDYLAVGNDIVAIGRKEIPRSDIGGISVRHTSFVRELVFHRRNDSDVVIKAYLLSRPDLDVLSDLQNLLFNANTSSGS